MRRYSPEPESSYRLKDCPTYPGPNKGGDAHTWNAIWLAFPQVDALLDPTTDTIKFFDGFPSGLLGIFRATLGYSRDFSLSVGDIMGDSPTQFVQAFIDHFSLPSELGGHKYDWQQTYANMWERAYQAEGLAKEFAAARESVNVILVDFTLKSRMVGTK